MSKKIKNQEESLRSLIRETFLREGCPSSMPCPIQAAEELKASGATPDEVMSWIDELLAVYQQPEQRTQVPAPVANPLSIVAVERYRRRGEKIQTTPKPTLRLGSTFLGIGFKK